MRTKRSSCFETNSSSSHSLTFITRPAFNKNVYCTQCGEGAAWIKYGEQDFQYEDGGWFVPTYEDTLFFCENCLEKIPMEIVSTEVWEEMNAISEGLLQPAWQSKVSEEVLNDFSEDQMSLVDKLNHTQDWYEEHLLVNEIRGIKEDADN